jgi:hypothetical protein
MGCLIHTPLYVRCCCPGRLSRSLTVADDCFRCLQSAALRPFRKDPSSAIDRWAYVHTSSIRLQLFSGPLTGSGGGFPPCESSNYVQLCGADGPGVKFCLEEPYRGSPGKAQSCFQLLRKPSSFQAWNPLLSSSRKLHSQVSQIALYLLASPRPRTFFCDKPDALTALIQQLLRHNEKVLLC